MLEAGRVPVRAIYARRGQMGSNGRATALSPSNNGPSHLETRTDLERDVVLKCHHGRDVRAAPWQQRLKKRIRGSLVRNTPTANRVKLSDTAMKMLSTVAKLSLEMAVQDGFAVLQWHLGQPSDRMVWICFSQSRAAGLTKEAGLLCNCHRCHDISG